MRARGFGLIDMLVGTAIALGALLVMFQVLADSEHVKRNTTAAGEAQVTGFLSSFSLAAELANAGNAIAVAAPQLATCEDHAAQTDLRKRFALSWRPLAVMIIDGGASDVPDAFAVSYSTSPTIVAPAPLHGPPAGSTYSVESANGFRTGDLVLAIEAPTGGRGRCIPARAESVAVDTQGIATITTTGGGALLATASSLFPLGPAGQRQKMLYDVRQQVLRATTLLDDDGNAHDNPVPNPLASNVINLKLQYGLDADADGTIDSWVGATGSWAADSLLSDATTIARIHQIKAIRIGIIVRSEQFDRMYDQDVAWSMFDGAVSGTYRRSTSPPGNWRYRIYETAVPLRNSIWNATP